jgi:hypothetical protein
VPASVDRSKAKEVCKGTAEFDATGSMVSCSKGYSNYAENYEKKERNYTVKEKILNFFRNLSGNLFWLAIFLLIFAPGVLGWVFGRVFNGINKAFDQTVEGVKRFRQSSSAKEELDNFLRDAQDKETKKLIAKKRV